MAAPGLSDQHLTALPLPTAASAASFMFPAGSFTKGRNRRCAIGNHRTLSPTVADSHNGDVALTPPPPWRYQLTTVDDKTREKLEKLMDELTRKYAETHDPVVMAEVQAISRRLAGHRL